MGEKVGVAEYRIVQRLGEGTFAQVYKCQDRKTGKYYACKRLKQVFQSPEEGEKLQEIHALKHLKNHPFIVRLVQIIYENDGKRINLILELMDGNLYEAIKERQNGLPEPRVKRYVYQVLRALDYMHGKGWFHRDVKPENILLKGNDAKLGDLGSCIKTKSSLPHTEYISTRWYRSPECLLTSGYYGPKMDIWALGCVFYEAITRRPLFSGSNEVDQLYRINKVLGSPDRHLLHKFRQYKSKLLDFSFPFEKGTGLTLSSTTVSERGKDLLRQMLSYDYEERVDARRAMEHRYFKKRDDSRSSQLRYPRSHQALIESCDKNKHKLNDLLMKDRSSNKITAGSKNHPIKSKHSFQVEKPSSKYDSNIDCSHRMRSKLPSKSLTDHFSRDLIQKQTVSESFSRPKFYYPEKLVSFPKVPSSTVTISKFPDLAPSSMCKIKKSSNILAMKDTLSGVKSSRFK